MTPRELRVARLDLGLSMRVLAERLGLSYATVRALECGERVVTERTAMQVRQLLAEQERQEIRP